MRFKLVTIFGLLAISSQCYAASPVPADIQIGMYIKKDIPLCRSGVFDPETSVVPGDKTLCLTVLPKPSLNHLQHMYKVWNAPKSLLGKITTVETYKDRVWRIDFKLGPHQSNNSFYPDAYIDNLSSLINTKVVVRPLTVTSDYSCGTPRLPKTCWSTIKKTWYAPDIKYSLEYARTTGTGLLTVEGSMFARE